jgi:hypothetical protein
MIIIPAALENYRSLKDKSLKITFETNELNPQDLLGIAENLGQFGYLAFKRELFKVEEKQLIEDLETSYDDKKKSASQRLRAVLYLMWQKDNEGFDTSVRHYDHHLEKIINHFKSKLD